MEPIDDLSLFSNENDFQPESSINPAGFMELDYGHHQFPELNNQVDDFLSHGIPTHEFVSEFSQNHGLSNDYSLASFHEKQESHHGDMHLGQTSFTGIYNDAEIEKMKDNVEHYQYVVDTLSSKVHHMEVVVDLAKHNKESINTDCKVDQLNDALSEYNNAISNLNDAKAKLNNAI